MPQVKVGWRSGAVAAPSVSAILLDTYSGAAAAYSLRKLSSTYTGSAIRVRRSSDNTELNIGFDANGDLDTVALSAFVGSGNGFVTTWYDQSGNSRNVAQTTAANQPRIVNAGAIELLNGKVCFSNYGQNQWLQLNSFGSNIASVFSFAMVGSVGNDSFRVALKFNPPSTGNNSKLQVNGFASLTSLEMQGSSSIYYSFPGVMNTTIPHIIQGTFNSTTSEFSVNNQTLLTGNAGPSTLNGIIIGSDWNGAYPTSGKYQEVVVWGVNKSSDRSVINTALNTYYSIYPNPTSVWNLLAAAYNADSVASPSLKTSLFAAYNGESNTNDSFGSNNGTAVGGLTYGTGKIGNAFSFNGTNAYVSLPNTSGQFNFTGDFTVSAWINVPNYTGAKIIFSNYLPGGTYGYGILIYLDGNVFNFELRNGNTIGQYQTVGGISTNSWNHIVFVRKVGQTSKVYINGSLNGGFYSLGGSSIAPSFPGTQIVNIGSHSNGSALANYKQDATTIWQKELTQSEITELYNSGNGAQYITTDFYKPTTNDALNTYNGTAQGGLTYEVGKVGTAFQFNGTNAYVSLPNSSGQFNFTGDFSISCWFKSNTISGNQMIFSNLMYNGGTRKGYYIILSSNTIGCWLVNQPTHNQEFYTSAVVSINTWYHLSVTRESGVVKIYLNGTLLATDTNAIPLAYVTTLTSIGAYTNATGSTFAYFNGSIDAFNIWQKALTQTEVTELYNSGNGKQYPN